VPCSPEVFVRTVVIQREYPALQNMPEDFLLRNVNGQDVWVSEGESDSVEIKAQSHVRIRIANVQLQPEKLVCAPLH
jgi:hypothetical protein